MRVLELMKMDMANFTIQQIRPYMQKQSVEYEKKKFTEFLKTQEGEHLLGYVKAVSLIISFVNKF